MVKFSREFLLELLVNVDLSQLIGEHLPLKRAGQNFVAFCPFHEERTPSFTVSPSKQFFYCFGCQSHGNAFDFLMKFKNLSFVEAVESLCYFSGSKLPDKEEISTKGFRELKEQRIHQKQTILDLLRAVANFYHNSIFFPQAKPILDYLLKDRGLSEDLLRSAQIGYVFSGELLKKYPHLKRNDLLEAGIFSSANLKSDQSQLYEVFSGRIIFPIKNEQGEVVGLGGRALNSRKPKYLNSKETPYFQKRNLLYGWKEAVSSMEQNACTVLGHGVILVEGYFDCLTLVDQGFNQVIAGLGTSISSTALKKILQNFSNIYVCYDGDTAGKRAQWKLIERILPLFTTGKQLYFVALPDGQDPDSFLREKPENRLAFIECLKAAKPLSRYFFEYFMEELDLTTEEGKASLMHRALPLIQQIANPEFRDQMLAKLGVFAGILDPMTWKKHAKPSHNRRILDKTKPAHQIDSIKSKVLKRLLALVLQEPQLARQNSTDLTLLDANKSQYIQLFLSLTRQAKKQKQASLSQRLEVWRGTPYYTLLCQLSAWQHCIAENHQQEIFESSCVALLNENIEQEVDTIILKAKQTLLTLEEKKRYLKLLTDLKK